MTTITTYEPFTPKTPKPHFNYRLSRKCHAQIVVATPLLFELSQRSLKLKLILNFETKFKLQVNYKNNK